MWYNEIKVSWARYMDKETRRVLNLLEEELKNTNKNEA